MNRAVAMMLPVIGALYACNPGPAPEEISGTTPRFRPVDTSAAVFWDRQTTETADLLRDITSEFNAAREGVPVKVVQSGNYVDIYQKVTASIQARALPAMAVAFESMVSEYALSGAAAPLDDLVNDPDLGLTAEDRQDFFASVLESNVYDDFGGRMYSFPYTKSVLMLFVSKRVLAAAGIADAPRTWDEFLSQSRAIKAATGKQAWAVNVDASTIDGLIYSMGGSIVENGESRFDAPESLRVFELIEVMAREGLLYQIPPRTFNDESAFGRDEIAFILRSSASKPHIALVMDDPEAWEMTRIPQADPATPRTVVFGTNLCIFNTTDEQIQTAFAFAKHFTSTETSVRWALGTGYVPLRKSAANHPAMRAYWEERPDNRAAFDSLAFARPEPNVAGWQEIRGLIEKAETAVITGFKSGREAALALKRDADKVLAARRIAPAR